MAIAYISSQFALVGNTITIPVGTTMAIGFCHRVSPTGISTPTLTGAAMTAGSISSDYVGIYYVDSPVAGNYTLGGFDTQFIYFSGTNGVRAGEINGTTSTTPLATSIASSYDDFVICIAVRYTGTSSGNITGIKIDGTTITYIQNYYEGYRQASGESAAIEVTWGTSGYTLYYAFMSIKSLVASDQSTFMAMIM
jgi:hypothetical protein